MNDLNGLDWSAKPQNGQKIPNYTAALSSLKPASPAPGRISPLSSSNPPKPPSKPATPANDSFSGLVSFTSNTTGKNLSLQEQQKLLVESKQKQGNVGNGRKHDLFAVGDDTFWNNLGSGRSTPRIQNDGLTQDSKPEEDDFLAAFSLSQQTAAPQALSTGQSKVSALITEDDDDPFELSEFQAKRSAAPRVEHTNDDDDGDVLGLLGGSVANHSKPRRRQASPPATSEDHQQDKAVAELVDMGFPADKARQALDTTVSGTDVQAAVGWLLTQAHSEAQEKSKQQRPEANGPERSSRSRSARQEPTSYQRDQSSGTPSNDSSKVAGEFGAAFLKTAGSLWKQGQKKVQQAVQDFNSDSDSSQPKWLRESGPESSYSRKFDEDRTAGRRRRNSGEKQDRSVTDEAMMLEVSRPERPARQGQRARRDMMLDSSADTSRDHSPVVPSQLRESHAPSPPIQRQRPQPSGVARATLSRQAAEEQAATAYVSSARRRKPPPAVVPAIAPTIESDLLEGTSKTITKMQTAVKPQIAPQPTKAVPIQVRPSAPARNIPAVSIIALKASHADREAGNEHFKRGDYSSAHQSYTKSLSHLPTNHPITIILLTNRALTALKTGEPKMAVADSDNAMKYIGSSKGESEVVDLSNGDTPKPMRDYYGKALMRKAEALEQMEKWSDAAIVWQEAVEGGHGGATSIQGRMRADKAANPQIAKKNIPPVRKIATKAATRAGPSRGTGASMEAAAVSRLRAQNAAAEKADDERLALSDSVDAKLAAWKGTKSDNLRALLGSLDIVLWPEAGWKKISMADLVLPNKVKIQYMKGIAKVHPDKIPTDASTEQRMIAGAVFSTLNEAWDKFKKENGL